METRPICSGVTGCGRNDPPRSDRGRSRIVEGVSRGPLVDSFAPILPARSGAPGRGRRMSLRRSDHHRVRARRCVTDETVRRDGCRFWAAAGRQRCSRMSSRWNLRLQSWRSRLIYAPDDGDGAHDIFTLSAVDTTHLAPGSDAPLSRADPADSSRRHDCAARYYLDRSGRRLMVYDGDRSDVPVVDHVVDLRFTYTAIRLRRASPLRPGAASNCAYAAGTPPVPLLQDLGGPRWCRSPRRS